MKFEVSAIDGIYISLILLLSIGVCFHMNECCYVGKWYAVLAIFLGLIIKDTQFSLKSCSPILLVILWCQIADIYSKCWSIDKFMWHVSLGVFMFQCKGVSIEYWSKLVGVVSGVIFLVGIFSYGHNSFFFSRYLIIQQVKLLL